VGYLSAENRIGYNPGRRTFVKHLLGFSIIATLGGVLAPVIGFLAPRTSQRIERGGRVRVASLAELQAVGGLVTAANDHPIVLTSIQGTRVNAFSAICTHLGCVVKWKSAGRYIECPCHDGRFNAQTGAVISGPPPSPLPPREVILEGDDVFVIA